MEVTTGRGRPQRVLAYSAVRIGSMWSRPFRWRCRATIVFPAWACSVAVTARGFFRSAKLATGLGPVVTSSRLRSAYRVVNVERAVSVLISTCRRRTEIVTLIADSVPRQRCQRRSRDA